MNLVVREIQKQYSFLDNLLTNFWLSYLKSNFAFKWQFHNIKWRNTKAKPGYAYKPTDVEKMANVLTHGIWIFPAVMATNQLFERSKTSGQVLVSYVYGGALTMLFTISTFFHCSAYCSDKIILKNILHRCDRGMIYVFIAASYFPWLQLDNASKTHNFIFMDWIIWILAALGITYQQIFHERFKCLETCFYIVMGLGPALVVIISGNEFNGMTELKLGGLSYIVGICFFKSDGIVPMAHAIWHLFVALAASLHYYAIIIYLYPKESNIKLSINNV